MVDNNDKEFLDPESHVPDTQRGLSNAEKKNLQLAGKDHPLVQRVGHNQTIEWNVPPMVLKNLAVGLYESPEATVREFLANAETATLRAENGDCQYVEDNYQPVIEVTFRADEQKIIIQDNGVGMSSSVVLEVVRNIGVTTGRNDGDYSGSFGMGLASFLKCTSVDGYMILKTHSRDTDENFAAYVGIGGFEPLEGKLPDDTYGTRFEMICRDAMDGSINGEQIRQFVKNNAEHHRTSVHYEEYDKNGKQVFDEDWGGKTIGDPQTAIAYVEEPGLFRACVQTVGIETETLLLSMPIGRNDGSSGKAKFEAIHPFSVRLLAEDGRVAKGPNKGKVPLSNTEYDLLEEDDRDGYIRRSELTEDDICLPTPTSSRDILQENEEFWKYVSKRLNDNMRRRLEITDEMVTRDDVLEFGTGGLNDVFPME